MNYIKSFEDITKNDILLVGGKALSLGIMTNANLPIPPGFVLTSQAYKDFYDHDIPHAIEEDILKYFDTLQTERVAVRSSAIAEDSITTSWAGQLDTFLNVKKEDLIENIKRCWNSMHSTRALSYAKHHNIPQEKMLLAVVVQKMIKSEISGVMFSANPVTKNYDEIMIEAVFGLGELLVQGLVTPTNFIIDKHSLNIKSKTIGDQDKMLIYRDGKNKEVSLAENLNMSEILHIEALKELGKYAVTIEKLYKKPQDIEWAKEAETIYIVQSRPITTL